jgi:hypothetical protein
MSESTVDLLRAVLAQMEAEVEPKLMRTSDNGGYDCCGCGTTWTLYDDIYRVIEARLEETE